MARIIWMICTVSTPKQICGSRSKPLKKRDHLPGQIIAPLFGRVNCTFLEDGMEPKDWMICIVMMFWQINGWNYDLHHHLMQGQECAWLQSKIWYIYLVVVDHKLHVLGIYYDMIQRRIYGLFWNCRMKNNLKKQELDIVWQPLENQYIFLEDLVDKLIIRISLLLIQILLLK